MAIIMRRSSHLFLAHGIRQNELFFLKSQGKHFSLRNVHKMSEITSGMKFYSILKKQGIPLQSRLFHQTTKQLTDATSATTEESTHHDPSKQILEKALLHVQEFGWTTEALAAGARDLGYPSVAHGMHSRGPIALVDHFMEKCNTETSIQLAKMSEELENLPVNERLKKGIEIRLRCLVPYLRSWHQAMALGAHPENVSTTMKYLALLSDDLWYHAGDQSTDFNWYTKRGVLGGIYASTEIFMLTDHSEDFKDTWAFLDRRINEAASIGEIPHNIQGISEVVGIGMKSLFSAAVSIAQPLVANAMHSNNNPNNNTTNSSSFMFDEKTLKTSTVGEKERGIHTDTATNPTTRANSKLNDSDKK